MIPILPIALGGAALLFLASRAGGDAAAPPQGSTDMPSNLLGLIAEAVRSRDPDQMRDAARKLSEAGFEEQAERLLDAADAVERAIELAPEPPRGGEEVEEVPAPPRGGRDVTPPGQTPEVPPPRPPVDVDEPPDDAEEVEEVDEPPPDAVPDPNDMARRIPPGTDELTAAYARMIYASAPGGPVQDLVLSEEFKRSTAVAGNAKFYGSGPAKAQIARGVVPATPWDWQTSGKTQDMANYKANLREAKRNDPARGDLWDAAIADVR